ncbi:hypothetical protein NDI76_02190 [Halogeometricum sp. S1BR25-6]|uniref:Uncharacterized protein n=1 Tax=Halogeometricum salsisoli TaxID=2950536 RepID=A0ABU2G9T4_9EURY|nr:hypothetical protein [Halogeometricum sp. S1BR25-6]MDS0297551.1 hypothetical protein [Halogeometricum sp. S1BR25-6]
MTDLDYDEDALRNYLRESVPHSIVQMVLGHPKHLATVEEINHFVADTSRDNVEDELQTLIEKNILAVYSLNDENLVGPSEFYGFTPSGIRLLGENNYLKGYPLVQAIYQKMEKPAIILGYEAAPRPELPAEVKQALRLNEGDSKDGTGLGEDSLSTSNNVDNLSDSVNKSAQQTVLEDDETGDENSDRLSFDEATERMQSGPDDQELAEAYQENADHAKQTNKEWAVPDAVQWTDADWDELSDDGFELGPLTCDVCGAVHRTYGTVIVASYKRTDRTDKKSDQSFGQVVYCGDCAPEEMLSDS